MTQPLICHFLIGLPASGKSTFARKLQGIIPDAVIVSTDTARCELYKDEKIQGDWVNEVEPKVLEQIQNAIASNKPVIYDATNVRRDWRMGMLMKIEEKLKEIDAPQVYWVAWHLQTPVDVCKEWNQKRDRQVPNEVIEEYAGMLEKYRIETGEGFAKLYQISAPNYTAPISTKVTLPPGAKSKTKTVTESWNFTKILQQELSFKKIIGSLKQSRNSQGKNQWHQYSKLFDFERLMYLVALILKNPGIDFDRICQLMQEKHGNIYSNKKYVSQDLDWLQNNNLIGDRPRFNQSIKLETIPDANLPLYIFSHSYSKKESFLRLFQTIRFLCHHPVFMSRGDSIEDIEWKIDKSSSINNSLKGNIYDAVEELKSKLIKEKIAKLEKKAKKEQNTDKLSQIKEKIEIVEEEESVNFPLRYILAFEMLLHNIDILGKESESILATNGAKLAQNINKFSVRFRKDIEKCLKIYQIIPEEIMDKGYFIGTAIFSKTELEDIYERMILPHKDYVDELVADEIYSQVEMRLGSKAIDIQKLDPIRKIGINSIVDYEFLPEDSLARKDNLKLVEKAITNRTKLRLAYLEGAGKHHNEEHQDFTAYPLMIFFHNIAWYLGVKHISGKNEGLYKFERLDRLKLVDEAEVELDTGNPEEFKQSLKNINKLYNASPGIFLGNVEQQQKFLDGKASAKTTIELWFTNGIFYFILEGMKRYKGVQMTDPRKNPQLNIPKIYTLQNQYAKATYTHKLSDLSEHDKNERTRQLKLEKLFQLETTGDENFPNRFEVTFPKWSVNDYDFLRWILGFGGSVKVKKPKELATKIHNLASEICQNRAK